MSVHPNLMALARFAKASEDRQHKVDNAAAVLVLMKHGTAEQKAMVKQAFGAMGIGALLGGGIGALRGIFSDWGKNLGAWERIKRGLGQGLVGAGMGAAGGAAYKYLGPKLMQWMGRSPIRGMSGYLGKGTGGRLIGQAVPRAASAASRVATGSAGTAARAAGTPSPLGGTVQYPGRAATAATLPAMPSARPSAAAVGSSPGASPLGGAVQYPGRAATAATLPAMPSTSATSATAASAPRNQFGNIYQAAGLLPSGAVPTSPYAASSAASPAAAPAGSAQNQAAAPEAGGSLLPSWALPAAGGFMASQALSGMTQQQPTQQQRQGYEAMMPPMGYPMGYPSYRISYGGY